MRRKLARERLGRKTMEGSWEGRTKHVHVGDQAIEEQNGENINPRANMYSLKWFWL